MDLASSRAGDRKASAPTLLAVDAIPEPESSAAQAIIGRWINACGDKRPPSSVIGQVGKHVKAMLAEGIDPDDVENGMVVWHRKRLGPSQLPSVVHEVRQGPAERDPGPGFQARARAGVLQRAARMTA